MALVMVFKTPTAQPEFTVGAAIVGTLESGQDLECTYTVLRATDDNVTVRWYSYADEFGTDQVLIATAPMYTLTGTEVGRYIRAVVTAVNPAGTVTSTTAYSVAVTANAPPLPPTVAAPAVITGPAIPGQSLTVTWDFVNEDSYEIQWFSTTDEPTGNPLTGSDFTELGTEPSQPLTEAESGKWIGVNIVGTNAVSSVTTSASVPMDGVDPYMPFAPAQYTPPAYDDSALEAIYCNAGDNLQTKLNELRPGKKLILEAGATWTGNFVIDPVVTQLNDNSEGRAWAYVISSDMASLPADGARVGESDAASMPKIQGPTRYYYSSWRAVTSLSKSDNRLTLNYASTTSLSEHGTLEIQGANEPEWNGEWPVVSGSSTQMVLDVPSEYPTPTGSLSWNFKHPKEGSPLHVREGCSKLRVAGIEITTAYDKHNTPQYALLPIGLNIEGVPWAGVGQEVVIDRCYVHGNATGKIRDGIVAYRGAAKLAIQGCRIDYFQGISTESHGVHLFETPGPVRLHNNAIITAGINVFLCDNGGGSTRTSIPADVTITKNYIAKRLEWKVGDLAYAGRPVMVKGLIESKGSKRVLVRGNVFQNAWPKDQSGQVWFHQNEGGDGVWDIDVRDNLAVNCGMCINIANPFDYNRGFGWQRLRFLNNLYVNPHGPTLGTIVIGNVGSGFGRYLTIKNNTAIYFGSNLPASMMYFNATSQASGIEHARIYNNILRHSGSGIGVGGNVGGGGRAAAAYHMTDFDFNKNVAVGESFSQYSTTYDDWRNWKSGNTGGIWGNGNVGYVSTAFTELGHFALAPTSQFYGAGTDGSNIGCDIAALAAQINASDNPLA